MFEFEPTPIHRPASPEKVLWFEFLLNPSILEKHLSEGKTDPGPTDLIVKFLANSTVEISGDPNCNTNNSNQNNSTVVVKDQSQVGNGAEEIIIDAEIPKVPKEEPESKKKQALKILALKAAAYLHWDLNTIEKKLPLTMQQSLLTELLRSTGNDPNFSDMPCLNNEDVTPDAQFARILYYTWLLRAVIEGSYPVKSAKGLNVPLPGQVDPAIVLPAVADSIMKKLNEESDNAVMALEEILEHNINVRMPLINCFGTITEECLNPIHKFQQGLMLAANDVVCQISYDIGRFYFFQEKYKEASKHFIKAAELHPELKNAVFCQLDASKLKGFYNACAHLLGYQTSDASTPLKETLQISVKAGHTKTIDILKSDNLKRELPYALRDAVELSILQDHENKTDLLLYVVFLNALRRTMSGKVIINSWSTLLKSNEERSSLILCELLKDVIPSSTPEMKKFLKHFVRMLCLMSIPAKQLLKKYEKFLNMIFSSEEMETLFSHGPTAKKEVLKLDKSFTDDITIQVAQLERRLLASSEAAYTKFLINQLRGKFNFQHLWTINKKWELPMAVSIFLKSVPQHIDQELIHILLAKTAELRAIQKYGEARLLYNMIQTEIRNSSPRLSRFLNWELLRLDLLEILNAPIHICKPYRQRVDIEQRIMALFVSTKKERDVPPDPNLIELCSAVLLNFRELDKLLEVELKADSYLEFSKAIASVCKEVLFAVLVKGSKPASKELWEIILPTFSNPASAQHKRSGSGIVKDVSRDVAQALISRLALQQFIKKLKDTLVLGILISCLAKFYNILKDDSVDEIFLEYQGLWPAVIPNSNLYNMAAVGDVFQSTLDHALSIHPTHTAWLRTKGDVMYVQGHYSSALKYYLSAAMVSSDFFSLPLPKMIFDDLQYKHMIHCCTKLQNHTQASVLHQFLEDPNYSIAFKALGERVCNDSCDTYYSCIWDVTLLEFLVNHHTRRGEFECRQLVMQLIGQLELNSNNNEEIQREAASVRKGWFLRAMAKQFL